MREGEDLTIQLQQAEIAQIDLLDRFYVVILFSNGVSAKLQCEDVKQLAIRCAVEMAQESDE